MSIASWMKEHMNMSASMAKNWSWMAACRHSINKYNGVYAKNLEKHNLHLDNKGCLVENDTGVAAHVFGRIDCALCLKASKILDSERSKGNTTRFSCHYCALYQSSRTACAEWQSPYSNFINAIKLENSQKHITECLARLIIHLELAEQFARNGEME